MGGDESKNEVAPSSRVSPKLRGCGCGHRALARPYRAAAARWAEVGVGRRKKLRKMDIRRAQNTLNVV